MFGSLGAAVQVVLILYPFILFTYVSVHTELSCMSIWLWLSHLQTVLNIWPVCDVDSCCYIHTLHTVSILVFFPVLSLKLISAIWWFPQWWAFIVLLSSLASCLVHRTPTSHRYATANLYAYLLSHWDIIRNFFFFNSFFIVTSKFLFISDNCKLRFTAYPEFSTACLFTHTW